MKRRVVYLKNGIVAKNATVNLPDVGEKKLDSEGSIELEEDLANLMVENGSGWVFGDEDEESEEEETEDEETEDEETEDEEDEEDEEEIKISDALIEAFKVAELKGFAIKGLDKELTKSDEFKALKTKAQFANFLEQNWDKMDPKVAEQIIANFDSAE